MYYTCTYVLIIPTTVFFFFFYSTAIPSYFIFQFKQLFFILALLIYVI